MKWVILSVLVLKALGIEAIAQTAISGSGGNNASHKAHSANFSKDKKSKNSVASNKISGLNLKICTTACQDINALEAPPGASMEKREKQPQPSDTLLIEGLQLANH